MQTVNGGQRTDLLRMHLRYGQRPWQEAGDFDHHAGADDFATGFNDQAGGYPLPEKHFNKCSRARFTRETIEVSVALSIVFSLDRHLLSGLVVQINLFVAFFL
jgi:hypothetical protein